MCSNSSVILCFSHGECPSAETTARFIRLCENFIERNPTELIGKALMFQPRESEMYDLVKQCQSLHGGSDIPIRF